MRTILITILAGIIILFIGCSKSSTDVTKQYDFENGIDGWHGYGTMKVIQSIEKKHEGKSSLSVNGTSVPGPWSYAGSQRVDLISGKRYKLSAWLRVESNGGDQAFMKAALFGDGKWISNAITDRISSDGQWHELTTEFEAPAVNQPQVEIDIEKRPHDKSITSAFYLDDVRIEALN
jgi:hypothetical protein